MRIGLLYLCIILAILIGYIYFSLPILNYGYTSLALVILLLCAGFAYLETMIGIQRPEMAQPTLRKWLIGISIAMGLYAFVLPILTSAPIFRAQAYRNLIGEVQIGEDFTSKVAPISTEKIRLVDEAMAYRLGDKVLGAQPSLGSQVRLGEFNIQQVNGNLYWVAPLLHSGFFKWLNNREGTPGYVMVSATNESDVELVQDYGPEVGPKQPVRVRIQPGAYFGDYLPRWIYFHGYMTQGFTDFTFEIDDEGRPYWVVTLYSKRVGFGGRDATGVITVDAETGDIVEYSIEEAPQWLDRIQPENFVTEQLDDWGEYVHGYFNFSNRDKLTTTRGMSLVYGNNNRSYWYTGLTSVGADEGTVGFVLVDTRTKETTWYKQVGATETAAKSSAQGKVQEKGYFATFPITYNINGIPTYVMSLKDQAGLIKMIAMVSVQDYTIVGVGDDMQQTLRAYKSALNSKDNNITLSSTAQNYDRNGTIARISSDIRAGNTLYYMLLRESADSIYVGTSAVSNELPLSQPGDPVYIVYDEGVEGVIDIVRFDNLAIGGAADSGVQGVDTSGASDTLR